MSRTRTQLTLIGFLIILSVSGLLANQNEIFSQAREAVKERLRDPESARFKDLKIGRNDTIVCGEVNAKNAMGGYVGARPFYFAGGDEPKAEISSGPNDDAVNFMIRTLCND